MDSIGLPEHRLLSVSRVAKPNKVPCKHYKNKSTTKFIPFSSAEYTSKSVHTGLGHSSSSNRSLASKAHSLNGSLGAEGNQNGSRSPVLILPGFLSNNTTAPQSQYRELADNLIALGHPAAGLQATCSCALTFNGSHVHTACSGKFYVWPCACLWERVWKFCRQL